MILKKIINVGIVINMLITSIVDVFAANPIVSVSNHGYDDGYKIEYSDKQKDCMAPIVLLFVNGDIVSDADAIIKNGTTLVPLRLVGDKLGATVSWDSVSRSVKITKGYININLTIGNKIIEINGTNTELTNPPEIINSLTYVPLRAIVTGFGSDVGYVDNLLDYTNDLKIVYVQDKDRKITITEDEAIKKAEDLYFNKFLPTIREFVLEGWNVDVNTVNSSNISEKLNMNYVGRCKANLGEYYYIQLFENSGDAVLVDKYDGTCYPVVSYSLMMLDINNINDYDSWGLQYQ